MRGKHSQINIYAMSAGKNRDLLNQIVSNKIAYSKRCKVESVDKNKFSCVVSYIENPDLKMNNVRLSPTSDATIVAIPKKGSTVVVSFFEDNVGFVSQVDVVEAFYIATDVESFLDIQLDLLKAIKAMQLTHPQGPTTPNGLINIADFDDIENRYKKFFLK